MTAESSMPLIIWSTTSSSILSPSNHVGMPRAFRPSLMSEMRSWLSRPSVSFTQVCVRKPQKRSPSCVSSAGICSALAAVPGFDSVGCGFLAGEPGTGELGAGEALPPTTSPSTTRPSLTFALASSRSPSSTISISSSESWYVSFTAAGSSTSSLPNFSRSSSSVQSGFSFALLPPAVNFSFSDMSRCS